MKKYRHIDLFSGIGGFALAAQWTWGDEHEVVCFCEMDKFCQRVLNKHWPGVPIVEDVNDADSILAHAKCNGRSSTTGQREVEEVEQLTGRQEKQKCSKQSEGGGHGRTISRDVPNAQGKREVSESKSSRQEILLSEGYSGEEYQPYERSRGTKHPGSGRAVIDLLTGGFPCQGFSVAGKQRGKEDHRYLWPQMFEVIKATRPRWVIGENVTGIIKLALDTVLSDLEAEGYTCGTLVIPACAKNAPHRRDRVWIVGHADDQGLPFGGMLGGVRVKASSTHARKNTSSTGESPDVADTGNKGLQGDEQLRTHEQGERTSMSATECGENGRRTERPIISSLGVQNDEFPRWMVRAYGTGEWEEGISRVTTGEKDRVNKLKALGNSVVPLIPYEIMKAIKATDENIESWRPME